MKFCINLTRSLSTRIILYLESGNSTNPTLSVADYNTLVYIKNHWFCKIDLLKLLSSKEAKLSLRKFANSVRRTRLVTG